MLYLQKVRFIYMLYLQKIHQLVSGIIYESVNLLKTCPYRFVACILVLTILLLYLKKILYFFCKKKKIRKNAHFWAFLCFFAYSTLYQSMFAIKSLNFSNNTKNIWRINYCNRNNTNFFHYSRKNLYFDWSQHGQHSDIVDIEIAKCSKA